HPLAGRRIVVTRPREQSGELARALEALGAEVVAVPTIRIVPLADLGALRTALTDPAAYDWIVFTSHNTVHGVFDRPDARALAARPAGVPAELVATPQPARVGAAVRRVGLAAANARGFRAAVIGRVTGESARQVGVHVAIEPDD